jgi:penicillin-binding protein 2
VVNEPGGTGSRAKVPNVVVAGKTGSAQAMTDGKSDTIAWFACFAPYENPRYAVAVMVQGGKGGGVVAAPIAQRILERSIAMEEGRFDPQLAWMEPANHPNPFAFHEAVEFKDGLPGPEGQDETSPANPANPGENAGAQMAGPGPAPDVEPEADDRGQVANRSRRVQRAQPVTAPQQPQRKQGFFERLFGPRRPAPQPQPAAPPQRRPGQQQQPRRPNQ